jgi:hypothetical protein
MQIIEKHAPLLKRIALIGTWGLIALGIVTRVVIFFQNRNLFIDEANVARNIYERDFFQLATPLSYEQYAPPVFLWMLKLFTGIGGYSEYAYRIYPMLAGAGALVVLYLLLREITSLRSIWYPVGLMAVSYIMIRYSSELKQYMSDALIVLSLILLALRTDIFRIGNKKFVLVWFAAGTVAIWGAMPSVFALAGVGVYYFLITLREKKYDSSLLVILTGVLWLAQFAIYYYFILKPQIESNYLQNFHAEYFLYATPENKDQWLHNFDLIKNLFNEASGFNSYAFIFNSILLGIGMVAFLIRDRYRSLLVLVPLAAVFLAAALNQYSLIPRVAIFIMPLFLILVGYGLEQVMRLRWKLIPLAAAIFGIKFIYHHSMIRLMWEPLQTEQVTEAMEFVMKHNIVSDQLYLHNGAKPAFIYYTTIHPDHSRWSQVKDAHLLSWDANYDAIASEAKDRISVIFTSVYGEDLANTRATVEKHMKQVASLDKQGSFAYIYSKEQ